MPKKITNISSKKVGQYKFDIFTLTTATNISTSSGYQDEAIKVEYFDSCADQHHQLIPSTFDILTFGGEEKKSFVFTDFFHLIFSLIIFVIKATLAKIGFTALLKSILATCIVLANKGNWGSKTWTAWHYIWERLTETNMDEQVFALYISSYTQKKLLGPRCIKIDMHVLSFGKPGFTYTLFW